MVGFGGDFWIEFFKRYNLKGENARMSKVMEMMANQSYLVPLSRYPSWFNYLYPSILALHLHNNSYPFDSFHP